MKTMTIGGLSDRTGVHIETIRYYERESILPKPSRNKAGRRVYDVSDVRMLNFIHKCRGFGYSLKEIVSLLELVDTSRFTCKKIHDRTLEQAQVVSKKIEQLKTMEKELLQMASQCDQGDMPECPIIDSLFCRIARPASG